MKKKQRLLKFIILATIVLLSCSTSWCQNNVSASSSTGVLNADSDSIVCIPISYIKAANAKMLELKYEKEINSNLRNIIINDSVIIDGLNNTIVKNENIYKKNISKVKKERNISYGISIGSIILFIISLL